MVRLRMAILLLLLSGSGCAMPDLLFSLLGSDNYTEGGVDSRDKFRDYSERVEAWESYQAD